MPAKSKEQQRLFGMVHAYQKGELKDASEEVKDIAKTISKKDAKDFAETKHKGLPNKVKKSVKETVKINESQLRQIISESVARILKEEIGADINSEFGGKAEYSPFSSYGDVVSIKVPTADAELRSNVVKFMQQQGYQLYNSGQLDGGAKCMLDFKKGGLNEEAYDFLEGHDFAWNNGYDTYVLVDDSTDAVIQNYTSAEGYDAKADAINDAKEKARETRGGSFSVFGCANGMYDDNSLVYCTSNNRNSWKF